MQMTYDVFSIFAISFGVALLVALAMWAAAMLVMFIAAPNDFAIWVNKMFKLWKENWKEFVKRC